MRAQKSTNAAALLPARALGYTRVSTVEQAREGLSLEAQEAKIRQWAALSGFSFSALFVDAGVSGKKLSNRPALAAALEDLRAGDALVVYSLSRLARSTRDTLDIAEVLKRKRAHLVSLSESLDTTSAAGKMVFRMLAVFAEFERDVISERTTTALQQVRVQGRKTGGAPPWGFSVGDGGALVPNASEAEIVAIARELRSAGWSLRRIGAELTLRGFVNRNGKPFHASTVSNIVSS